MYDEGLQSDVYLFKRSIEWLNVCDEVAMATVIATWGSSPRPVGSQMVLNENEMFQGSVSGGCIESTLITEALYVIRENASKRISIGLDDRNAWDYGLGCGGIIDIYIEPVSPWKKILNNLCELIESQQPCCLITNLSTGEKFLITPASAEELLGADKKLFSAAKSIFVSGQSCIIRNANIDYFFRVYSPAPVLIIGGAVHIAQSLLQMAQLLAYRCVIIDPRTIFATKERFPNTQLIMEHPKSAAKNLPFHTNSAVVVLSHSPQFDDPLLIQALKADAFYVGALGSRKTHAERLKRLQNSGLSGHCLKRIHGPVGIDIGSKTPAEIALSIMAEIVLEKRKKCNPPIS